MCTLLHRFHSMHCLCHIEHWVLHLTVCHITWKWTLDHRRKIHTKHCILLYYKKKPLNRGGNSYFCYLGTPCKQIFKQFYFQAKLWKKEFSFRMICLCYFLCLCVRTVVFWVNISISFTSVGKLSYCGFSSCCNPKIHVFPTFQWCQY
jgi:hypothetical protein